MDVCGRGQMLPLLLIIVSSTTAFETNRVETFMELREFIETIKGQRDFESTVYLKSSKTNPDHIDDLHCMLNELNVPKLLLTEEMVIYLKHYYNSDMLVLVYLENTNVLDNLEILQSLVMNLQHARLTRVLFLLDEEEPMNVTAIFQFCENHQMLNVLSIFGDFSATRTYYSFNKFPKFQIEKHEFLPGNSNLMEIYPNRLMNVQGYNITTLPDDTEPRTIVYYDRQGKIKVTGYIWRFLEALAEQVNASLVVPFPLKPGRLASIKMLLFTRNGSLDIPASLNTALTMSSFNESSYPLYSGPWCMMVPQEREIPKSEIFPLMMCSSLTLIAILLTFIFSLLITSGLYVLDGVLPPTYLDILLDDRSLRGHLGQSFAYPDKPKLPLVFIFVLLFLSGLIYVTTYMAYYQTFITSPPLTPRITNLEELYNSGMRVLSHEIDKMLIPPDVLERYPDLFNWTSNVAQMRDSLKVPSGFMVTTDRWYIYEHQQSYFARRLTRMTDICFNKMSFVNLMLPENSIYRPTVNHLINEMYAAGLMEYWLKSAFSFMLETGKMSYEDWSEAWVFEAASFEDFYWVWIFFFAAIVVCLLCFAAELIWYRKSMAKK